MITIHSYLFMSFIINRVIAIGGVTRAQLFIFSFLKCNIISFLQTAVYLFYVKLIRKSTADIIAIV